MRFRSEARVETARPAPNCSISAGLEMRLIAAQRMALAAPRMRAPSKPLEKNSILS